MDTIYKNGKINKIVYIGIFGVLFLSAGFTSTNDILPNFLTKVLWVVLFFVLVIKSELRCNKKQLYITLFVCVLVMINAIINDSNLINAFMYCFGFVCVLFLVNVVKKEELMKCYTDVMYHLCIISLICWCIFWFMPEVRRYFVVSNAMGNMYNDILVFSFNCTVNGIPRNQGMFWEPGAFSTFIILALVFESINKKLEYKRFIIFLVTLLTTFSTTGYFTALFFALFLLLKYKGDINKRRLIIALFCMVGVLVAFMWDYLIASETYSVFGKLIDFMNAGTYGNRATSVSIRIDSIIRPIGVFFRFPIFGCGAEKLNLLLFDYTKGMNTCTFINWFAIYGLFFGIIMLCGIIKMARAIANTRLLRVMVTVLLLMTIMTENFTNSPIIFMVALLGYGFLKGECVIEV